MVQFREHLRHAELVVDVKKIPELMELSYSPARACGSAPRCPVTAFMTTPRSPAAYPGLVDAARIIGGWQIQGPREHRRQPLQLFARGRFDSLR